MPHLTIVRTSDHFSVIIDNLPKIVGKNRQFKKSLFSKTLSTKVVKTHKLSVKKHIIGITDHQGAQFLLHYCQFADNLPTILTKTDNLKNHYFPKK